jgi:hypothetical protein
VHKFYVISPYRRVGIISRSFAFVRRFLASNPTCCRYSESFSSKITSISPSVPLSFPFPFVSVVPSTSQNPISYLRHQVLPSSPHLILAPRSPRISIRRLSLSSPQMYYDPYPPRTGPAAMPSPRSKIAPYFSGRRGTFEDFLEEFEARAYDCRLTDPQRVDTLISYVDSSFREKCKSLNGYRSCDWSLFRHSLINTFGTITPHHQLMKQKLHNFVEESSRLRMNREDDVLQYYRTFQHYSDPLVHSGHLTEKDRDIEFWYGFHRDDRDALWPRLLALYPFQPHDIPFHFERIFDCVCRAFSYGEHLSFGPQEQEFESRNVTRRLPRYPSSSYTSDLRPFPSYSESQHTLAPSVQPEPEPELMPSITPTYPSAPSLASSCTNVVPKSEPESTSNIPTSSPLPPTTSLASSCTANIAPDSKSDSIPSITSTSLPHTSSCTAIHPAPEPISEHAFSSVFPSTSPVLSIPSIPSSCTDAVTEPEPESLLYSTPSCHIDVPEPECTLSTLPMSTSPAPSSANGDSENMTTHSFPSTLAPSPSFSNPSTELECSLFSARSATEVQLPELASPLSTSPYSSTGAHTIPNVVEVPEMATVPELELALIPDRFAASFSSHSSSLSPSEFVGQLSVSCIHESTPESAIGLFSLGLSESSSESRETIPILHPPESPLKVSNVPVLPHSTSQARSQERTFEVTSHEVTAEVTSTPPLRASAFEVPPSLSDRSHASPSRPLSTVENSSLKFGPESSLGEIVPIVPALSLETSLNVLDSPHLSPPQPLPEYTQVDAVSAPLEALLNILAPPHSTPPQRPLGVTLVDPRSSLLDLTLAPVSLTPSQEGSLNNEVSSTPAPRPSFAMHPPHSSSSSSIDVNFAFTFVTLTVLVSALFVVSAVIPTHSRESWAKNEDLNNRDNTTVPGNAFDTTQLFRPVQYKPHTVRLVFDPGGFAFALQSHTRTLTNTS